MSWNTLPWPVIWTGPALRDLEKLDRTIARQVREAVNRLADTGQGDMKHLRSPLEGHRLRVRDWRVLLSVDEVAGTLTVRHIRHRSKAYR